jgi:hypothetical protein
MIAACLQQPPRSTCNRSRLKSGAWRPATARCSTNSRTGFALSIQRSHVLERRRGWPYDATRRACAPFAATSGRLGRAAEDLCIGRIAGAGQPVNGSRLAPAPVELEKRSRPASPFSLQAARSMSTRKASEMQLAPTVRRIVGEQIHLSVHGADCLILFARRRSGMPLDRSVDLRRGRPRSVKPGRGWAPSGSSSRSATSRSWPHGTTAIPTSRSRRRVLRCASAATTPSQS